MDKRWHECVARGRRRRYRNLDVAPAPDNRFQQRERHGHPETGDFLPVAPWLSASSSRRYVTRCSSSYPVKTVASGALSATGGSSGGFCISLVVHRLRQGSRRSNCAESASNHHTLATTPASRDALSAAVDAGEWSAMILIALICWAWRRYFRLIVSPPRPPNELLSPQDATSRWGYFRRDLISDGAKRSSASLHSQR